MRLVSAAVPQVQELRKNFQLPQATPEALLFFTLPIEREEIARKHNFARLSKHAVSLSIQQESCVQASDLEDTALATFCVAMSSIPRTTSQIA